MSCKQIEAGRPGAAAVPRAHRIGGRSREPACFHFFPDRVAPQPRLGHDKIYRKIRFSPGGKSYFPVYFVVVKPGSYGVASGSKLPRVSLFPDRSAIGSDASRVKTAIYIEGMMQSQNGRGRCKGFASKDKGACPFCMGTHTDRGGRSKGFASKDRGACRFCWVLAGSRLLRILD